MEYFEDNLITPSEADTRLTQITLFSADLADQKAWLAAATTPAEAKRLRRLIKYTERQLQILRGR